MHDIYILLVVLSTQCTRPEDLINVEVNYIFDIIMFFLKSPYKTNVTEASLPLDVCVKRMYRVASVSQYGTNGFVPESTVQRTSKFAFSNHII